MRILMADDDADDRSLASIAFTELNTEHQIEFVNDGQELMDYLNEKVKNRKPLPDLILLDLNMPRKDGRTALKEIKANKELRQVDVIIFSTSNSEADKTSTIATGAKSYIVKPHDYTRLVKTFKAICEELVDD